MVYQRFRLRSVEVGVIIIAAALAALAVFARLPETVMLRSVDGVVTLVGEVPRSIGEFRIVRDDALHERFSPDGAASVYRIEPVEILLPQSVTLLFSLSGAAIENPETLALAWWNGAEERWELAPSVYDARTNAIRAPIRILGFWTLRER